MEILGAYLFALQAGVTLLTFKLPNVFNQENPGVHVYACVSMTVSLCAFVCAYVSMSNTNSYRASLIRILDHAGDRKKIVDIPKQF